MPGYSFDGFDGWGGMELFDRRRAKRRQGKDVPAAWESAYGSLAAELWQSGLASRAYESEEFDDWAAAIESMREAVLEAGALACWIAPRFFVQHPAAMEDMEQLALIDAQMLDQTRSKWSISEGLESVPKARSKTL
jgi:hypothetical protein